MKDVYTGFLNASIMKIKTLGFHHHDSIVQCSHVVTGQRNAEGYDPQWIHRSGTSSG